MNLSGKNLRAWLKVSPDKLFNQHLPLLSVMYNLLLNYSLLSELRHQLTDEIHKCANFCQ
jgi:hypothetical protein